MSGPIVIGFISREDYPDFCRVSIDFPADPPTYDWWLNNMNKQLEELRAQGIFPVQVNIKPLEMAEWCKSQGLRVDKIGRPAYATWLYTRTLNK